MVKATAAIFIKDGHVLLARRKANLKYGGRWEFPGGKIEKGETPQACLAREIHEELDIIIEIGDFFAESFYKDEHSDIYIRSYFVIWLSGEITLKDHDRYEWVLPESLMEYDLLPGDVPFAEKLKIHKV